MNQIFAPMSVATLSPREAYDLSARYYDDWKWQSFWRTFEYPIVRNVIERAYSRTRSGLSILDIGCGTGWYLEQLADLSSVRAGLDISPGMLSIARSRLKNVLLKVEDIESYNFKANRYDVILATRVLSHIRDPFSLVVRLRRSLHKSGWLILSDIDPSHNYVATKLPLRTGSIFAETFKHDRSALFERIEEIGFLPGEIKLIRMNGESVPLRRFRDHFKYDDLAGWVAAWRKSLE